jgi:hypothetical protein
LQNVCGGGGGEGFGGKDAKILRDTDWLTQITSLSDESRRMNCYEMGASYDYEK